MYVFHSAGFDNLNLNIRLGPLFVAYVHIDRGPSEFIPCYI